MNCGLNIQLLFEVNQSVYLVFLCEPFDQVIPVLMYPANEIGGNTAVKGTVPFAGQNVDLIGFAHSFTGSRGQAAG